MAFYEPVYREPVRHAFKLTIVCPLSCPATTRYRSPEMEQPAMDEEAKDMLHKINETLAIYIANLQSGTANFLKQWERLPRMFWNQGLQRLESRSLNQHQLVGIVSLQSRSASSRDYVLKADSVFASRWRHSSPT
jgi:hypothetical protein